MDMGILQEEQDSQRQVETNLDLLTNRLAKGGGVTLLGSGFGKLLQFGFHILLGRVLGPGAYGLYALGFSLLQLVSQISDLGLRSGIVRFIAIYQGQDDPERVKGTLISAFSIATLVSLGMGTAMFIFAWPLAVHVFHDAQLSLVLRVFAVALPFFMLVQMSSQAARGFQQMNYYVAIQNIIWPVFNTLLVGIAFLIGFRLLGAIYGFLASAILAGGTGLILLWNKVFPQEGQLRAKYEVKGLLRFSLPVIFIGFGQFLLNQTDRVMLGYFLTSVDVGIYSAAAIIAMQITFFVSQAANLAFAPMIADLHSRERLKELDGMFKRVTRWVVTLTLPWVLIMVLFPEMVMGLFGTEYIDGSLVLVILALAFFIDAATGPVGYIMVMTGKQDIELINTLSMAVVNVGLNLWLIPLYGIIGAAIATGLSTALTNIVRLAEVRILVGIQPYTRKLLKPLLAGGLVAPLVIVAAEASPGLRSIELILSPFVYIISLLVFGLEAEDKRVLKALYSRVPFLTPKGGS